MSTTITVPKNNIPIGRLQIGDQVFDITQTPEFTRFFFDLARRAGGTTALTNTDLENAISSLEIGEMVVQASPTAAAAPDVVQPDTWSQSVPDVTQAQDVAQLGEVTWQI